MPLVVVQPQLRQEPMLQVVMLLLGLRPKLRAVGGQANLAAYWEPVILRELLGLRPQEQRPLKLQQRVLEVELARPL